MVIRDAPKTSTPLVYPAAQCFSTRARRRPAPGLEVSGQFLILVRGDVVRPGFGGSGPAPPYRVFRAEIVAAKPAVAAELSLPCAIEGVKTNPEVFRMSVPNESFKTNFLLSRPFAGRGLTFGLHDAPAVVPPAVVVVGGIGF